MVAGVQRHGSKTYRAMPKEDRRMLMRQCIQQHRDNGELYRAVMYPSYRDAREDGEA